MSEREPLDLDRIRHSWASTENTMLLIAEVEHLRSALLFAVQELEAADYEIGAVPGSYGNDQRDRELRRERLLSLIPGARQ